MVFLGYVLSADGISANPEKVDIVKNWPVPMSAKELHSFLGLASYYCHFIPKFAVIAKCLHDLVGPTNVKRKNKKEPKAMAVTDSDKKFNWTGKHQEAFDLLKTHLTSAPVLGHPDFSRPFDLETNALLQGLGAVLSQRDENGKSRVIAYANRSLQPNERTVQNYSSAKLELLVLKWVVTEKFRDYLLGSQFTAYTDNNPLAYIKESKLRAVQIRWLSKLALFDFDIKYRTGKSNQAADALSHHPKSSVVMSSDRGSEEEYETISYEVISDDLSEVTDGIKIPIELKNEIQKSIHEEPKGESDNIQGTSAVVDVMSKVSPEMMRQAQEEDLEISKVRCYVMLARKPSLAQIRKLKSKIVCRYLRQFDRLIFIKGVLHRIYEENGSKYHQLVLPTEYRAQAMVMLHDENGHQGVKHTVAPVGERSYLGTMLYDIQKLGQKLSML